MMSRLAICLAAAAATWAVATPAAAQGSNPLSLSKSQVIDEFARGAGIGADAAALSLGNTPAKLEKAQNYLATLQIVSQLADARDDAAASTAVDWVLGKVKDKVVTGPAAAALTAVTLYKASLEGLRDWVVYPRWNEQMYQEYKRARTEGRTKAGDGPETIETAYNLATGAGSAYESLKRGIYDDLIRAKGLAKDHIGPRLDKSLWAQIDAYLEARMELRYQRDYLREHRDEITRNYWQQARAELVTPTTVAGAARPGGQASAADEAVLQRYKAAEEARMQEWLAYDKRVGNMETEYRWDWPVLRIEGSDLLVATVVWKKYDSKAKWSEISIFGSAQNPMRISLSTLRAKYPPTP